LTPVTPTPPPPPPPTPSITSQDSTQRQIADREFQSLEAQELLAKSRQQALYDQGNGRNEAFSSARQFARCAVGRGRESAAAVLDQSMPSLGTARVDTARYYMKLRACAAARATLDGEILKGALAEQLIATQPRFGATAPAATPADIQAFISQIAFADGSLKSPVSRALVEAECRAAASPMDAYALVNADLGTTAFTQAAARLDQSTAACNLFPNDKPIAANYRRAMVARGLYYWGRKAGIAN
jgi:hypothetical protein